VVDSEIDHETPDLPPDFTEAVNDAVTSERDQPNADPVDQRPAEEAAVELPRLPQAKLKVAKKVRVGSPGEKSGAIADLPVLAKSSTEEPFFEKATSLDEDIKHLKDLLAQKLRIQNAQLREMLKRFERS